MEKAYWSRYPRSLSDQCGGTMYKWIPVYLQGNPQTTCSSVTWCIDKKLAKLASTFFGRVNYSKN